METGHAIVKVDDEAIRERIQEQLAAAWDAGWEYRHERGPIDKDNPYQSND